MPDELLEVIRTSLTYSITHIAIPIIIMFVVAGIVLAIIKSSLERLAISIRRILTEKKQSRKR